MPMDLSVFTIASDSVPAGSRMPLAQAHPFEPMPVTHEEEMQEVSKKKQL